MTIDFGQVLTATSCSIALGFAWLIERFQSLIPHVWNVLPTAIANRLSHDLWASFYKKLVKT